MNYPVEEHWSDHVLNLISISNSWSQSLWMQKISVSWMNLLWSHILVNWLILASVFKRQTVCLSSCYSKGGPRTSKVSITCELRLDVHKYPVSNPNPRNQNLRVNKMPQLICMHLQVWGTLPHTILWINVFPNLPNV